MDSVDEALADVSHDSPNSATYETYKQKLTVSSITDLETFFNLKCLSKVDLLISVLQYVLRSYCFNGRVTLYLKLYFSLSIPGIEF